MRQEQIRDIVSTYITKYTCATMADWLSQVRSEQADADDWLFTKINELKITKEELEEAVNAEENKRAELGHACIYAKDLFSTRFFRS